jgi:hypothetical protein
MNASRRRWLVVAVLASAFFLGITAVALAAEASSARATFFGPVEMGGTYICGKQQATIDNTSEGAFLETSAWHNTSCSAQNVNRPAGQLAAEAFLWKGASGNGGVLYATTGWVYNNNSAEAVEASAFCPGSCPSAGYYSSGKGRIWNSNTQVYETSSFLSNSPDLNFP